MQACVSVRVCVFSEESLGQAWRYTSSGPGDSHWELEPSVAADKRAEGARKLVGLVAALSTEHLDRLLRYTRDWNAQSKHNLFAQQVRARSRMCVELARCW